MARNTAEAPDEHEEMMMIMTMVITMKIMTTTTTMIMTMKIVMIMTMMIMIMTMMIMMMMIMAMKMIMTTTMMIMTMKMMIMTMTTPGVASVFTPRLGTVHECSTSVAVMIGEFTGSTIRLSVSSSGNVIACESSLVFYVRDKFKFCEV
jgi:hypothetical protein